MNQQNQDAWNKQSYDAWLERFGTPADMAKRLRDDPAKTLQPLTSAMGNVNGKKILNLMGSNGTKAVALALLGARVTVVDFSDGNRRYATDLAEAAGTHIEYIVADVLSLEGKIEMQSFDIVFAEMGILHYFTELKPFMDAVFKLLSFNGLFILRDFHPVSTKLISYRGSTAKVRKYRVDGDYFDKGLKERDVAFGKFLPDGSESAKVLLRAWNLGEIISAVAGSGFVVQSLEEEPNQSSDVFDKGIPKTYTLTAGKVRFA